MQGVWSIWADLVRPHNNGIRFTAINLAIRSHKRFAVDTPSDISAVDDSFHPEALCGHVGPRSLGMRRIINIRPLDNEQSLSSASIVPKMYVRQIPIPRD
jgi:hypothetical protein